MCSLARVPYLLAEFAGIRCCKNALTAFLVQRAANSD